MAPEFSASDFPGSAGYMQGGMYDENGEEQPMGPCLKSMASAHASSDGSGGSVILV